MVTKHRIPAPDRVPKQMAPTFSATIITILHANNNAVYMHAMTKAYDKRGWGEAHTGTATTTAPHHHAYVHTPPGLCIDHYVLHTVQSSQLSSSPADYLDR